MHKPMGNGAKSVAITAAAMVCAVADGGSAMDTFRAWSELPNSGGEYGLYDTLAEYAILSEGILDALVSNNEAFDGQAFDFPGVFDYEVSGEWGAWFGQMVREGREVSKAEGARELGHYFWAFFTQDKCFADDPANAYIIHSMTGYRAVEVPPVAETVHAMTTVSMPCISVVHISHETMFGFLAAGDVYRIQQVPFKVAAHAEGLFLTVARPEDRADLPQDLQDVFACMSDKAPFGWIMVDVDGDVVPGLPVYPLE